MVDSFDLRSDICEGCRDIVQQLKLKIRAYKKNYDTLKASQAPLERELMAANRLVGELQNALDEFGDHEYMRRNRLHASAVGAEAGARVSLARVKRWKNPPKWLVESLEGVYERAVKVSAEMAAHRNEIHESQESGETK